VTSSSIFLILKRGNMLTRMLAAALTKEQREAGFWLSDDVDWLTLYQGDRPVARFTIHATVKAIRDEADRQVAAIGDKSRKWTRLSPPGKSS